MIQSPIGQDGSEVRVILVGATGLDAALRRDPAIELIRTRTPLDAIGELADPIDDTSPTRSVVIVSPETARTDAAQVRQFIEGLRLIDPHVRVLRITGGGPNPVLGGAEPALFDAEVSSDDAPEDLLAVIRGQRRPTRATPSRAVMPGPNDTVPSPWVSNPIAGGDASGAIGNGSNGNGTTTNGSGVNGATNGTMTGAAPGSHRSATPEPAATSAPALISQALPTTPAAAPPPGRDAPARPDADAQVERKPARAGIGDQDLAAEVARGRDPAPLAMEVLRARLGGSRVELLENEPGSADAAEMRAVAAGVTRAPVRWGETAYGVLEAGGVAPADLQRHADWLATWMRLGEQHRELRDAAYRDSLTGAWNRRYFDRFFEAALAKSRDGRHNLTLLVFDIDDFKVYNDRYGHAAGDEILVETVRLLQATVRPTDRVCRIGGDEFAVVFYEPTGPREAGSRHPTSFFDIAKRFQKQVWEHRFPKLGAQAPGTLTISGGLATFPWDGTTVEELLDRADRLAMDSKRLGKNAITLGPGAMRACNGDGC